jgi:hypothetical protein
MNQTWTKEMSLPQERQERTAGGTHGCLAFTRPLAGSLELQKYKSINEKGKKDGRIGLLCWHCRATPPGSLNCAKSGYREIQMARQLKRGETRNKRSTEGPPTPQVV